MTEFEHLINSVWFGRSPGNRRIKYKFEQKSDTPIYEIGRASNMIIFINESYRSTKDQRAPP